MMALLRRIDLQLNLFLSCLFISTTEHPSYILLNAYLLIDEQIRESSSIT